MIAKFFTIKSIIFLMRFLTNSNPYPCSEISSQIYGRKKIEEEIKDEIKESFLFGRNDFSFFLFFFSV